MRKSLCFLLLSLSSLIGSVGFCQVSPSGSVMGEPAPGWARPSTSIWGMIGPPTLHLSWAVAGSITANATAAGNLSQSFSNGLYSSTNVDMNAAGEGKLRFDAQGLWLGATIPVRLTNALTLRARGEYFFPSRDRIWTSASGNNAVTTTFFFGGIPDPGGTDNRPGHLEFGASTKTRWFFVDAELTYSEAVLGSTSILAGIRSALHGDMNQAARNRTLSDLRRGKIKLLVATDVAARGIDVITISHVFNFDLPMFAEDYVHRIGRTGRAGASGTAISFASAAETAALRRIERYIGQTLAQQVIPGLEPTRPLDSRPARSGRAPARNSRPQKSGEWKGRGDAREKREFPPKVRTERKAPVIEYRTRRPEGRSSAPTGR